MGTEKSHEDRIHFTFNFNDQPECSPGDIEYTPSIAYQTGFREIGFKVVETFPFRLLNLVIPCP
jgi:hypothetical protein